MIEMMRLMADSLDSRFAIQKNSTNRTAMERSSSHLLSVTTKNVGDLDAGDDLVSHRTLYGNNLAAIVG
jgi:hypothetical protein